MSEPNDRSGAALNWTGLLEQLSQPFPASAVYWRAGSTSRDKKRAQALPYAEPRVYEDRLNTRSVPVMWRMPLHPVGRKAHLRTHHRSALTRSSDRRRKRRLRPRHRHRGAGL